MQLQKTLVARILSGEPASPLLLEGYDFGALASMVRDQVTTHPTEPLIALGRDESGTMDEIRGLISRLHRKGHARRYVLLEKTHKFRKDGLNALLKLLEEPPADTHIILTALPYATISTIRSRCSIVKFLSVAPSTQKISDDPEPTLADRFYEISKRVGEESYSLLESFIVEARRSFLNEVSPKRAQQKIVVINSAFRMLKKGTYSKVSLQNIFVMWKYA